MQKLKFRTSQKLLFVFWFLACFPGRLGYDYALLTRMVQDNQSTAWWGSIYFWIFKLLTFGGLQIVLLAVVGLFSLTFAVKFFIESLPISIQTQSKSVTFIMATPLYGVFGMTISHDVFQTCGMLIISGLIFRSLSEFQMSAKQLISISILASTLLLTTQSGIVIVVIYCVFIFFRFTKLSAFSILLTSMSIYFFSNIGISSTQTTTSFVQSTLPRLMLIDLKCIVQHPEAQISAENWNTLTRYALKSQWLTQTNCSNPDDMASPLNLKLLESSQMRVDSDLVKTFLELVAKHPAIPVVSHIQRSRVALPPPFFQPPTNQIPWDVEIPIGQDTNIALQNGPGLLHPSVDEKSVDINFALLIPLEVIAQFLTLLINQASWFWSWGGLWLWPISIYVVNKFRIRTFRKFFLTLFPTLTLHFLLFCIGPSSLGRYVMSTILQGVILTYVMFVEKLNST